MARDRGKQWEEHFKSEWKKTFPNTFIMRIPDQMSFYKHASRNMCDFIALPSEKLFVIECKTHLGNSFPLYKSIKDKKTGQSMSVPFSQYDLMLKVKDLPNVYAGVMLWLEEKDLVAWISIQELEKMIKDGIKSISSQMIIEKKYNIVEIPHRTVRVFPECDFKIMLEVRKDGQGTNQ